MGKIIQKLKKWIRKHKKWAGTNASYLEDFNAMKEALKQQQEIIYLKPRGFGKSIIFNNIIAEFESKTGSKLEDWQHEIFLDQVGLVNKSFYRNLRTGQIVFDKKPISETDLANLHTEAERNADKPKGADMIFLNEQQLLDKEFMEKLANQYYLQKAKQEAVERFGNMPKVPPNTPSREQVLTDTKFIKTINATDIEWLTPEKLAEIKANSKKLSDFEWQKEYMAEYEPEEKKKKKKD